MRPSSWLSALSCALCLTGIAGLASVAFSFVLPPQAIGWLLVAGGGIGLAVAEGAGFVVWLRSETVEHEMTKARTWALELDNQRKELAIAGLTPPTAAPEIERLVPYRVAGDERTLPIAATRSARWNLWQKLALGYLDWVAIKHDGTSAALVGPALMFSDRGHWVEATNGLRAAGLVEKANGAPTALVGTIDEARARVRAGECKWRDDADPPPWRATAVVMDETGENDVA